MEKTNEPEKAKKFSYKQILELLAAISITFSITWNIKVNKTQYDWNKKIQTVQFLEKREKSNLRLINQRISNVKNPDSLLKIINEDSTLNAQIRSQLNDFEDLGIGYNIEIYDASVINKYIGTSYIKFNKKMQPYIQYARNKNNNPNLYKKYDICSEALSKMK
jgi:hypothetical protein